jgi:hypothetical protein
LAQAAVVVLMADFFVSYTKPDQPWAEWIAYALEANGYSCIVQAWDFRPGANFVVEMQQAAQKAARTVAVLSPAYLLAAFPEAEWAAAFADDPQGLKRKLVPVRIEACRPEGLLKGIVYIDLVGLDEAAATPALLNGIKSGRAKPATAPAFPGRAAASIHAPIFPGRKTSDPEQPIDHLELPPSPSQHANGRSQTPSTNMSQTGGSMENRTDAFLRALHSASELADGGRLTAEHVNGLGDLFQIERTDVLNLVEQLQSDGLVSVHWGGGLALTGKGRERATGRGAAGTATPGNVSIGDIAAGANVNIHSPNAVVGYQTGAGATGAGAIRIEAPVGDLAAALQALRAAHRDLSGLAKEQAQALDSQLQATLQEVQHPAPNQAGLEKHIAQSRTLLERLSQAADATNKLKPALSLAGTAIGAIAKWLGITG